VNKDLAEPVTLCLINYNGLPHLQQALAAVRNLQTRFDEILVIDNASTDGSLDYLHAQQQLTVVALSANAGPAAARNVGLLQARNDIILFQDNDISLTEGVAQALYAPLKQDQRLLLTMPRVVYSSDPAIIQFEGANCHILGMMSLRHANIPCSHAPLESAQASSMVSACFMINRRLWQSNTPLFDEDFIFNLEDHDLGVRANLLGYRLIAVPAAKVLHGSGSEGLSYRPGREVSTTRMYCLIRNRWWIIMRYFSLRTLIVMGPLLLIFEILQLTGLLFKGWGGEWWRAFVDTGRHIPVLYNERKRYQQQRQSADSDFLRDGKLPLTVAISSSVVVSTGLKIFEAFIAVYWRLASKLL
jgi:GT2 family glycosyltransferase